MSNTATLNTSNREGGGGGGGCRERDRLTDRQTDRDPERQRHRQRPRETQTDRQTETQTQTEGDRDRDTERDREKKSRGKRQEKTVSGEWRTGSAGGRRKGWTIQYCFTSTETMRLIRDWESRTATSTFTQLLSSDIEKVSKHVA